MFKKALFTCAMTCMAFTGAQAFTFYNHSNANGKSGYVAKVGYMTKDTSSAPQLISPGETFNGPEVFQFFSVSVQGLKRANWGINTNFFTPKTLELVPAADGS